MLQHVIAIAIYESELIENNTSDLNERTSSFL